MLIFMKETYLEDCETVEEELERQQEAKDETVYASYEQARDYDQKTKYHKVKNCATNGVSKAEKLSRYDAERRYGYVPCDSCVND